MCLVLLWGCSGDVLGITNFFSDFDGGPATRKLFCRVG
ncbi:hypothetical protein GFS31_08480 [Leptolyngbya sp. BL0902]|nr:hypothetical protein GFS31_08480 [Leptolyngbya sp. BL0902]